MKLGFIGLKGHQSRVLNGAKELGGFEVVGIAESDEVKVASTKRQYASLLKDAPVFEDWRRLLDHSMMDVCCVCDENGVRYEQLTALAKAGVHVVTEKPLTTTVDDLDALQQTFASSRSRLTMLLTMRHEAPYVEARKRILAGEIGEPALVTAQKSYRLETRPDWFRDPKRLGGTIPYIGIHAIDLMHWVTDLDYTDVTAIHGTQGKRDIMGATESQASVLLRMKGGVSATARLDYLRPHSSATHGDDRLRVAGTKGILEYIGGSKSLVLITDERGRFEVEPEPTSNLFVEFLGALNENRPSRIEAADCFYITRVVLEARRAAENREWIELTCR
jgi:predicted dehydrogenase